MNFTFDLVHLVNWKRMVNTISLQSNGYYGLEPNYHLQASKQTNTQKCLKRNKYSDILYKSTDI